MIFSVPRYRRLSEEDLARLDKDDPRSPSRRLQSALLNVLLLTGLWGLPFYGRSVVLSAMDEPKRETGTIIGKWRTTDGSHFQIAFNRDGQLMLSWKGAVVATARYSFQMGDENVIALSDFRKLDVQIDEGAIEEGGMRWFGVSWKNGKLSTTFVFYWERQTGRFRPGASWRIGGERLTLPSAVLERIE
jgi:hypothetical protein